MWIVKFADRHEFRLLVRAKLEYKMPIRIPPASAVLQRMKVKSM